MTLHEIHRQVAAKKPVSKRQVIRYIKNCGIQPSGMRQRPQQYPSDAAKQILVRLGLDPETSVKVLPDPKPHFLTLRQLKAARKASGRGSRHAFHA